MKLCKINFRCQQIVHSIHTTQQHKTGVVNIYLYGCVNLLAPVCCIFVCVCVCLCVCNIKSQSTSKKQHYQSIPQTHFASYFQKGKIFPSGKESVFPFTVKLSQQNIRVWHSEGQNEISLDRLIFRPSFFI